MSNRPWVTVFLAVLLVVLAAVGFFVYQSLTDDITQLSKRNDRSEARADDLARQKQTLEDQLSAANQRLEQRNTSADQLEAELNELRQVHVSMEAKLQVSEQRADTLQAKLDTMASRLKDTESRLAAAQSDLTARQTKVEELTARLDQASRQSDTLTNRRDELEAALAKSREEKAVADRRIDDLTSELNRAHRKLDQAEKELASRKDALETVSDQRKTVEQQYQQAREQLALQASRSQSDGETIAELEARMAREREATDSLQSKLQALSHDKEQLISRLEDGTTVIKLPEQIVFDSGSAEIGHSGRKTLMLLADALASFPDHLISIQGHTDSRTISPALQVLYPTNWELSTARAASAVRVLKAAGIAADRMQAVGFADTRPLVEETDAASRRQNRRIEVLLYPNQFRIKAYQPGSTGSASD